jgi:hypothetical protein
MLIFVKTIHPDGWGGWVEEAMVWHCNDGDDHSRPTK